MNRSGPGAPPLRNMNQNVFQSHQSVNSRPTNLGSGRLQNGKIANGPSWGYGGIGAAGATGPQAGQARPSGISSFAQTIGGGHNHAPFDQSFHTDPVQQQSPIRRQPERRTNSCLSESDLTVPRQSLRSQSGVLWRETQEFIIHAPKESQRERKRKARRGATLSGLPDKHGGREQTNGTSHLRLAVSTLELEECPDMNEEVPESPSSQALSDLSDVDRATTNITMNTEQCDETEQVLSQVSQLDVPSRTQIHSLGETHRPRVLIDKAEPPGIPLQDSTEENISSRDSCDAETRDMLATVLALVVLSRQHTEIKKQDVDSLRTTIHARDRSANVQDYSSDFPSLSNTPQTQQNSSQAVWGSSNVRAGNTNAPVQRPPVQTQQSSGQPNGPSPSQQQTADSENVRPSPFAPLNSGMESLNLGYDDHGGTARDLRRIQNQGTADEFPPLGGLGPGDLRQGGGQASRLGGIGAGSAFAPGQPQARNGPFQTDGHNDSLAPLGGTGGRMMSPSDIQSGASRSPLDGTEEMNGTQRHPLGVTSRLPQNSAQDPLTMSIRGERTLPNQGSRYPSGEQAPNNGAPVGTSDNQASDTQQSSDNDKWSLKGFLQDLRDSSSDHMAIRIGIDLNTLGLDLNRQGPLWSDWAGPFTDSNTRPVVPDFKLPDAYTVRNVPPLEERIPSFSDETLFTIFYLLPRDRAQEHAAQELYSRDWRWHKRMQQWMMKAKEFGEPVQLPSQKEERGWYYFFDVANWKRERKEFILNYEHLYHPSERVGIGGTL